MNLQDVVDELAQMLGRSVVIDRTDDVTVAASGPRDAQRTLAVPIRDEGGQLGTLWLAEEDQRPLTSAQYSAIDVATGAVRQILALESGGVEDTSHAATMARLLSEDPAARRRAFSAATMRHWLERGERSLVRAVSVDTRTGVLDRLSFGRHLGSSRRVDLTFLGQRDGILYFVGRTPTSQGTDGHADDVAEVIRREARARGLPLLGIGSARLDRRDDDLAVAAEQARRAAEIVTWLPHLDGLADISQLGAWVLLDSIAGDGSIVGTFSPAAITLWQDGNALQLETVETFLDACGRVRDACEKLHIHRTTLYYRLDNLPPVVRSALEDGMSRSALHICLKLLRFWEATGRI
ncbi:hypothetical protein GCM10010988_03200 [Cnuibacter physcomitrellae]|uniref:Uncharacterized protein n=1 Tax=Cnuibacter physcomitrellae TaxID=1619308 RepID=A0A1X9LJB4_9MICO|nr:helix-turn-helix domain-containing protein [Cnuibacter physcomitrellae]ARJ05253.1 hypothetical protein B5808_08530 [Cnuibacter physcomitrellae]GGI35293.1 hypothetical protein GCM10010988_03200 [Cnuibacter physcomitrellae]